jgi:hypothetical protein
MPPSPSTLSTSYLSAMQSPTTIGAGAVPDRGDDDSLGTDSERALPSAARRPRTISPSGCTAVGAELCELARSRSSVCEPPGFIAAESSPASGVVETRVTISC